MKISGTKMDICQLKFWPHVTPSSFFSRRVLFFLSTRFSFLFSSASLLFCSVQQQKQQRRSPPQADAIFSCSPHLLLLLFRAAAAARQRQQQGSRTEAAELAGNLHFRRLQVVQSSCKELNSSVIPSIL